MAIQKAVHSYWNHSKSEDNFSGFASFKDMLASTILSLLIAKPYFEEFELVTNNYGKSILIDKLDLPYTSVRTDLNKWDNLNPIFWGFMKICAYAIQDKPFLHIDNDVYLITKPSEEFLNGKLCFQSIETPFEDFYGWYKILLETAKKAKSFPNIINKHGVDYAFNCGVAGANDLEIIKEWVNCSAAYVLSHKNKEFFDNSENYLQHQNLLHEQYFIASLSKIKGYENNKDVQFILNSNDIHKEANGKFVHLWGTTKRLSENINKVYNRLKRDYPEYYERIINYK